MLPLSSLPLITQFFHLFFGVTLLFPDASILLTFFPKNCLLSSLSCYFYDMLKTFSIPLMTSFPVLYIQPCHLTHPSQRFHLCHFRTLTFLYISNKERNNIGKHVFVSRYNTTQGWLKLLWHLFVRAFNLTSRGWGVEPRYPTTLTKFMSAWHPGGSIIFM